MAIIGIAGQEVQPSLRRQHWSRGDDILAKILDISPAASHNDLTAKWIGAVNVSFFPNGQSVAQGGTKIRLQFRV